MKLKITQAGNQTYTGYLGTTEFDNGVSVDDVSQREALRLGAILSVEFVNGDSASPADKMREGLKQPADEKFLTEQNTAPAPAAPIQPAVEPAFEIKGLHTRQSLEELADKGGINALRAVGNLLGVKNSKIQGLMDEIIAEQSRLVQGGLPVPVAAGVVIETRPPQARMAVDLGDGVDAGEYDNDVVAA
jgi:hypothetical protein